MGYDKYTCVLLIYGWCHYFYEVFIIFVFGCPELKPSRVNNIGVILDLMGLLHKKTDFNYFIKSTSVIKWSVTIRNDILKW